MANFKIKKGFNLNVQGKPIPQIVAYESQKDFAVYPEEFEGLKPRLKVKVGDLVKRGDILFENKKNEAMQFRAPCAGEITNIHLGARRFPVEISIQKNAQHEESITFKTYTSESLASTSREDIVNHLLNSGLWPLVKQRPFNIIAEPEASPKAIFINAASSAPFEADFNAILNGKEAAFQLGIDCLNKLTEGTVHLCQTSESQPLKFDNVQTHSFEGKHPAGNTSVHINQISPILPHDTVYTLKAQDVILIGELLKTGELPRTKVIALGGPSIKEEYRKHYRVEIGATLEPLLKEAIADDEVRLINGTILWGEPIPRTTCARFYGSELTALPEDRSRNLLGWTTLGLNQYSCHRVNLSNLLPKPKGWVLGTNLHGSKRAMVVTGWMDKYQPLNIMTDYLIRAALAHDTDEMVQLGILETDPEDFALASFLDPHKTDVCGIIKRGLEEIQEEGI